MGRVYDILQDLDVAEEDQVDLFETLDVDGNGVLSPVEMILGISRLRGEARRADIIATVLMLRSMQSSIQEFAETTKELLVCHGRLLEDCHRNSKKMVRMTS